ncbi:unnamed protein product [Brachionus calyciflorus]|uniref:C2H2-type domain-containing protein n=1 Tax=Brachionus calyciflorus TaxID=104777 RepID=A0A814IDQ5_9BILA|nr:unnamed protein product [Brachionus calyciflorus]
MPKKVFKLPVNLERDRLKNFYRPQLDKMNHVSEDLKKNFYDFVIPSLAEPKVIKEVSDVPRYLCYFVNCKKEVKSFASKQKFVQHLTIIHDQELPEGGSFISPNDKSTIPGGFWCSKCGHHYCRRDHLQHHFKSNLHCREAEILLVNPLIQKEIAYEQRKAIEYPSNPLPRCEKFNFKPKEVLAIEWKTDKDILHSEAKSNSENMNKKGGDFIKKISKSLSMFSISKSKKTSLFDKPKSKTIDNIFNLNITFKSEKLAFELNENSNFGKRKLENDICEAAKIKIFKNEQDQKKAIAFQDNDEDDVAMINALINFEKNNSFSFNKNIF